MAVSTLKYSPRLLRHERLKASLALETLRADSELRILNDELMRQEKSTDAIQVNALLHTRTRTHALTRSRAHAHTGLAETTKTGFLVLPRSSLSRIVTGTPLCDIPAL